VNKSAFIIMTCGVFLLGVYLTTSYFQLVSKRNNSIAVPNISEVRDETPQTTSTVSGVLVDGDGNKIEITDTIRGGNVIHRKETINPP
jgi:hypothetical protein